MESSQRRGAGVASRKRKQEGRGRKRAKRLRGLLDSTVMVRHVHGLTEEHLSDYFQNYGDVAQVRLVEEQAYAFVTFQAKETAQGVISALSSNEGITVNGLHKKVQVSWAAEGLPKDANSGTHKEIDSIKKKKKHLNHVQGFRCRCKSRLFISAVASAVASSGVVVEGNTPRPPSASVDISNREVIAYDDWL
ncbi:hypothetical protein GOP47_0001839 [Adiantum capillus-veneris]|uniref:RRM domain-containing protein n=1 Tax=Adiantum capillus-veneris TaxID=13818 RepID=A0A9D4V908_ADICA|nr:hypothetical protein GOP47_0001839 [Adiantum capillus-veneris]